MSSIHTVKLSNEQIDADIATYLRLLDDEEPEAKIQAFLASHVYFFNGLARSHVPIYSKVKLGAEYEIDFAFHEPSSFGTDWYWVEIENPSHQLFTRAGNPSAPLHHAMEQIRDWNRWLHENVGYARKLMPLIEYPLSFVFIGRRAQLDEKSKAKLRRLIYENRHTTRIHTLDRFADLAASARGWSGSVLLDAYTHAQMARGEPRESYEWLRSEHTAKYKARKVKRLLDDRERGGSESFEPS